MSKERTLRTASGFYNLDLDKIEIKYPENGRTGSYAYEGEDFDELVEAIREQGVQMPLKVCAIKGEKGMYKIAHGFRRMKAVQKLVSEGEDITFVPVKVVPDNMEQILIEHITLNTGLPLTDLDLGSILNKLHNYGYSNVEIAKKTGISVNKVQRLLVFEESASKATKNAVADGKISMTAAHNFATSGSFDSIEDQNEALDKLTESAGDGKIKVADVEKVVAERKPKKEVTFIQRDVDATVIAIEEVFELDDISSKQAIKLLQRLKKYGVKL